MSAEPSPSAREALPIRNTNAARVKQNGMMWGMPGAIGMLQLRASLKSRRFRSDHERLLPFSPPQETERMAA